MNYKIFKLKFNGAVHLGDGFIDSSSLSFQANTLFSALYIEALKFGLDKAEQLLSVCKNDLLKFSDAFPFKYGTYFLPKPYLKINSNKNYGDSIEKKALKKLQYISVNEFDSYLNGDFDIFKHDDVSDAVLQDLRSSAFVRTEGDTEPYQVGYTRFKDHCGLYLIIGYEEQSHLDLFIYLLHSLQTSGIGGKRHSGYGQFSVVIDDSPQILNPRLNDEFHSYMTLSISLPKCIELDHSLINASYSLCKKGGFVQSDSYAATHYKKKNLYLFSAGSVFKNKFEGDVFDVSTNAGNHPVYKYAKPLFLGVDNELFKTV